jgi:predicted RNA binding protein YcfA (HicA-like mRNA interferase family)
MMRLVRRLEQAGYVVTRTGSGHWKVQHPRGGEQVIMGFSPTGTAFHKTMKRLREIGYHE